MDSITIDPAEPTRLVDRRYRRSEQTTSALAYQCAHIQEALELEALIVSDDAGDRWVGSGDASLCRLLSRSAPAISTGEEHGAMRMRALQVLRQDLQGSQITTCRIRVPNQERFVFVTGVGMNRMRPAGVAGAAGGTRRILGYDRQQTDRVAADGDASRVLQGLVDTAYARLVSAHGLVGAAPSTFVGLTDDRVYRDALQHVLAPALDALARSNVVVDDPWRNYRLRTREVRIETGLYERTFRADLREVRTRMRLGELEIRLFHRHDVFDIPYCPRVNLAWR